MFKDKKPNVKRKMKQKANYDIVNIPTDMRGPSALEEIMIDLPLDAASYKPNDNTNHAIEGDDFSREDDFN